MQSGPYVQSSAATLHLAAVAYPHAQFWLRAPDFGSLRALRRGRKGPFRRRRRRSLLRLRLLRRPFLRAECGSAGRHGA